METRSRRSYFARHLRPTRLSVFYLGLATVHVVGICAFWGRSIPGAAETWLALTSPVGYEAQNGATKLYFNPLFLGSHPIPCYIVAALLARKVYRANPKNRVIAIFGGAVAMMAVISFLLAIGASKAYWGYYFARPGVLREIYDVKSVNALIPVTITSTVTEWSAEVDNRYDSPDEYVDSGRRYPYYCLEERLLLVLDDEGLAPDSFGESLEGIPPLPELLQSSNMLVASDPGYNANAEIWGLVYDTVSEDGKRLLFLGLRGSQVSDDHLPFYEMVFSIPSDTTQPSFIRGQRFFFDVAGIEGMEWYVLGALSFSIGFVIVIIGTALALTPWGWLRSLREPNDVQGS